MKKILAACSIAAFAVLGTGVPAQAAPPKHAAMNHESYW